MPIIRQACLTGLSETDQQFDDHTEQGCVTSLMLKQTTVRCEEQKQRFQKLSLLFHVGKQLYLTKVLFKQYTGQYNNIDKSETK